MQFKFIDGVKTMFGYDAIADKKRRTAPRSLIRSEDAELSESERRQLVSTPRDMRRNMVLLAWMIRKHLDYVSRFEFRARTGDLALDDELNEIMRWWSRAKNCDISERHDLMKITRLIESCRVVDGDVGVVKLNNGRIQVIEGDRIAKPTRGMLPKSLHGKTITNGLIVNSAGRVQKYVINKRVQNGTMLEYERTVSPRDFMLLGYFNRIDQFRGVSPLSAAINIVQDLYEVFEYQLIKTKIQAMFGVAIKRKLTSDTDGFVYTDRDDGLAPDSATTKYDFELKAGLKLELDPDDEIDTIESHIPSAEFQNYSQLMIQISLLALDIPMTFFDSRKSSYSAQRQDLIQYIESAKDKRRELRAEFLDEITAWKIGQWTAINGNGSRLLTLPRGMLPRQVKWEWTPTGIPWIDPLKEVNAYARSISVGLRSRQQISAELGYDWKTTIDQLAEEEQMAIEKGVTIEIGNPGAATTRDEEAGNEANEPAAADNTNNDDE